MVDNRTISQLEAEGYPWIGCECCKGTVWVPFRMLRERRRGRILGLISEIPVRLPDVEEFLAGQVPAVIGE
jgi:hypothetical protein